jgi:cytochrome c biogenesis protein CcmG, thiol:disulfide interchange protein DsbE
MCEFFKFIGSLGVATGLKSRMNKPFAALGVLLSLLGVSIAVALLVVGCRQGPFVARTTVWGPVSCGPSRERYIPKCEPCMKAACCAEYIACANDAPCPCGLVARLMLFRPAKSLEMCGPMNASFAALSSCLDANCAETCPADDGSDRNPLIGKPAPEILAEAVGGDGPRTIEQARGKVVILDFWATWCGPCKASFPKYQQLVDRFRGEVVVIAISLDDPAHVTTENLRAVAKETGVRFPILWDKQLRMAARYSTPNGLPASFVIDRSGTVRSLHVGYDPALPREIEELVKAPPQAAPP